MKIGPLLRRARALRRRKQQAVADLAGVAQTTVSRWEAGAIEPSAEQLRRLGPILTPVADLARDSGLKRLVVSSPLPVHLVCDLTHRLLAASPAREVEWTVSASELHGEPLFRFATDEIREAESRLDDIGWFADATTGAVLWIRGGDRPGPIRMMTGYCVWERLTLNDGSPVRLVTTLPAGVAPEAGLTRLFDGEPQHP
jgi:transcriptional regulator with XRE-family HTH domain